MVTGLVNRITAIRPQKKDGSRISIFVDDEFRLGCSAKLVRERGLVVGGVLEDEQIRQLQETDELAQAKAAALRLLGHRARTQSDLTKRLQRKNKFADDTIANAVNWLVELGYVNDMQYARDRLAGLVQAAKLGRQGLVEKLVSEGVPRAPARELVDATVSAEDEAKWAQDLASRKASRMAGKPWPGVKRNIASYLRRHGFEGEHIFSALEALDVDS